MPLNTLSANIDYGFVTIPLDNSLVSIKVWLLKNPFMVDSDFSGENISLRSIFKFNNYRNFSLFDRLQYISKFKYREFLEHKFESKFLKAQVNNDMQEEANAEFSLILKVRKGLDLIPKLRKRFRRSKFREKEYLPLLSDINDEEENSFGNYDVEPSSVYFLFQRKHFLQFLKLPDGFFYESKDKFLKSLDSDIKDSKSDLFFFFLV